MGERTGITQVMLHYSFVLFPPVIEKKNKKTDVSPSRYKKTENPVDNMRYAWG